MLCNENETEEEKASASVSASVSEEEGVQGKKPIPETPVEAIKEAYPQ
jgi:hypothetical protein